MYPTVARAMKNRESRKNDFFARIMKNRATQDAATATKSGTKTEFSEVASACVSLSYRLRLPETSPLS